MAAVSQILLALSFDGSAVGPKQSHGRLVILLDVHDKAQIIRREERLKETVENRYLHFKDYFCL